MIDVSLITLGLANPRMVCHAINAVLSNSKQLALPIALFGIGCFFANRRHTDLKLLVQEEEWKIKELLEAGVYQDRNEAESKIKSGSKVSEDIVVVEVERFGFKTFDDILFSDLAKQCIVHARAYAGAGKCLTRSFVDQVKLFVVRKLGLERGRHSVRHRMINKLLTESDDLNELLLAFQLKHPTFVIGKDDVVLVEAASRFIRESDLDWSNARKLRAVKYITAMYFVDIVSDPLLDALRVEGRKCGTQAK